MDIAFILRWRAHRIPFPFFNIDKISKEIFRSKFFVFGFFRGASVSAAARRGASLYSILCTGDWRNLEFSKGFFLISLEDTPEQVHGSTLPWRSLRKTPSFLVYKFVYKILKMKIMFFVSSLLVVVLAYLCGGLSKLWRAKFF